MADRFRYVTLAEAIEIHALQLARFGGSEGIRDRGLIEAALLRPQTGYYGDLIEEAAALWESLAMSHGFVDGNERVAFACTDVFLRVNGSRIPPGKDVILDFIYSNMEAGTFTKDVLEAWLRETVVPR